MYFQSIGTYGCNVLTKTLSCRAEGSSFGNSHDLSQTFNIFQHAQSRCLGWWISKFCMPRPRLSCAVQSESVWNRQPSMYYANIFYVYPGVILQHPFLDSLIYVTLAHMWQMWQQKWVTEPAHHLNHHVPGTELQSDSVRSLWSSAPVITVMYCNVIKTTNRDKNEWTKRIRKGKIEATTAWAPRKPHAIHSRGPRFKSFMSKCYMPQASFTPYLLSQTSDRLEGWYLGHVTESQDTDCTQTHYIVIVHCAHCISLYSLCKPTLHHVTMSQYVTCRQSPSTSSHIVTCRMSGVWWWLWDALGCPGMPWRHGRLWWCLSRPGSREGHNGTEDNQRQPKTTSELFKTEKNWRRAKILTVSLDRRSELTAHRWL